MRPVLSRAGLLAWERAWMEAGVPGLLLMENAGRGAAHLIGLAARPRAEAARPARSGVGGSCVRCADEFALRGVEFVILVGPGNNGGDGLVVARHLLARGASVRVLCAQEPGQLRGDAALMFRAWLAVGGQVERLNQESLDGALRGAPVVVDALLGTGACRPVPSEWLSWFAQIEERAGRVIALDVPSGLDADTGALWGGVLRASHTVTFGHLKRGLLTTQGQTAGGRITVSHLGVPALGGPGVEAVAWLMEEADLTELLPLRSPTAHKGQNGKVVVFAGSPGKMGAGRLTTHGAFRAGAGVVVWACPVELSSLVDGTSGEVMSFALAEHWSDAEAELTQSADVLVVGPGLGQTSAARQTVSSLLEAGRPLIVDAEGLRLLPAELRALRPHPALLLTPHPGEAAALLGQSVQEVEADRFAAVTRLAEETGAVVVLKGSRSLVAAPGEVPWVSAWGSAALATAGSGDVLAGILAGLWGQELRTLGGALSGRELAWRVARCGVGLHALAGQRWAEKNGDAGLLASEIADELPSLRRALLEQAGLSA